jgi:PIN domain nuclease of toxin-antitoxin system
MTPVQLDSHVLLWALFEPHRLGKKTRLLLRNLDQGYVSRASMLELTFKYGSGKLPHAPEQVAEGILLTGATVLEITDRHLQTYASINLPHKDPFDRLLLAQAVCEGLTLVTADANLLACSYPTLDARL